MATLPSHRIGWLAGARDPIVGAALAALHRDPSRAWTVGSLAKTIGTSRSVVAERFMHFLAEPPMSYLAHWRLQSGARLLETTQMPLVQIAESVGYDSQAAFNRAFKKVFELPPGRYRRRRGAVHGR
jgi:transcriptional regulator GlxA family with amidase domain